MLPIKNWVKGTLIKVYSREELPLLPFFCVEALKGEGYEFIKGWSPGALENNPVHYSRQMLSSLSSYFWRPFLYFFIYMMMESGWNTHPLFEPYCLLLTIFI